MTQPRIENEKKQIGLTELFSHDAMVNPYPVYDQLRSQGAAYWDIDKNSWLVTGYREVLTAFHSAALSVQRVATITGGYPDEVLKDLNYVLGGLAKQMAFQDPPNHTRLRKLMNKAFTPRAVEAMRPRIEQIVSNLLDQFESVGQIDLINNFAYSLPTIVNVEILGISPEYQGQFRKWTNDLHTVIGRFNRTHEQILQAATSLREMCDYLREVVNYHRKNPTNNLMSALVNAEEQGDTLTEEELITNCVLLLMAGHENVTNLIGNGMLALLRNPEQLSKLRTNPNLIEDAVVELLRYDCPVQLAHRIVKEDQVQIGEKVLSKGQNVYLLIGAANRDPSQFARPNILDITRSENRQIGFGPGIHHCLGAPLALIEGEIAIGGLLHRFTSIEIENETAVKWQMNLAFRGLQALPITYKQG